MCCQRSDLRVETLQGGDPALTSQVDAPSDPCLLLYCVLRDGVVRVARRCVVRIVDFSKMPTTQLFLQSSSFMLK